MPTIQLYNSLADQQYYCGAKIGESRLNVNHHNLEGIAKLIESKIFPAFEGRPTVESKVPDYFVFIKNDPDLFKPVSKEDLKVVQDMVNKPQE